MTSLAQIVIRNLDAEALLRLRRRAELKGRSMEEEMRDILRDATKKDAIPVCGLGTKISSLFKKIGLDEDIPEHRGYGIKPPSYDK